MADEVAGAGCGLRIAFYKNKEILVSLSDLPAAPERITHAPQLAHVCGNFVIVISDPQAGQVVLRFVFK